MKYLIIVSIFSLCVFIGFKFSSRYTKRKKFFDSIIVLADKLSMEINFSRERLKVLLENCDTSTQKNLLEIDKKYIDFLDKKCELNTETIFGKTTLLNNDEKQLVVLFFKTLGRSDVENQTKEIKSFIARFSEIKNKCDIEQKKYGSLSAKLGVVAGLMFAIVLF